MGDAATEAYQEGLTLYGQQRYGEAIAAHRRALEERPDWSDAMQALGMSQLQAGQLQEAVRTLERVVELAPEDPLAFTSLSMAYQRAGRIEDAERAQDTARMLSWKTDVQ